MMKNEPLAFTNEKFFAPEIVLLETLNPGDEFQFTDPQWCDIKPVWYFAECRPGPEPSCRFVENPNVISIDECHHKAIAGVNYVAVISRAPQPLIEPEPQPVADERSPWRRRIECAIGWLVFGGAIVAMNSWWQ